ncbi:glutamine-hydrolyzing GMP synthase [uncultured Helicobacter sp.]|uniref:glutamine-hydrolyzing GMP synthase n=1 Tax=uncultured Helicobacter sp. TaxID=175537 RepID=UPI00374F9C28
MNNVEMLVLDFGSQYTQLIARRLREFGVYTEIVPYFESIDSIKAKNPKGIILSGGPASVYEEGAYKPDNKVFELGIPVLGICYGMQYIAYHFGGAVVRAKEQEFGKAQLEILAPDTALFGNVKNNSIVWMSHADKVEKIPQGFSELAKSGNTHYCAIADTKRQIYALQFHPEVVHSECGGEILKNFAVNICRADTSWNMKNFITYEIDKIRKITGILSQTPTFQRTEDRAQQEQIFALWQESFTKAHGFMGAKLLEHIATTLKQRIHNSEHFFARKDDTGNVSAFGFCAYVEDTSGYRCNFECYIIDRNLTQKEVTQSFLDTLMQFQNAQSFHTQWDTHDKKGLKVFSELGFEKGAVCGDMVELALDCVATTTAPLQRCGWIYQGYNASDKATQKLYQDYHDFEWGIPQHDDKRLFEQLVLEGMQAGLSWITILKKREAFRAAFDDFDPHIVATYDEAKIQELMENPDIIRNRAKIESAINNAKRFLEIEREFGSFAKFLWGYVDNTPLINHFESLEDIPTHTPLSDTIANDLKKRGFSFVGSTGIYAFMQSVGLVCDHLTSCAFGHADKAKPHKVLCAVSGGVDSSVVATLLYRAIGENLIPIFVDTGLLRKGEREAVEKMFRENLRVPLITIDASEEFLGLLKGVRDPESKRKIIGETFIKVFDREAKKHNANGEIKFLAQGTLYPDVIESVSVKGPSKTIKSHHNVGGLPDWMKFELIEPLRELFKDEVRALGRELGMPESMLMRHPFPGPGLAIRIMGEVNQADLDLLKEADSIFIEELHKWNLYDSVWQAFCVLLNVKSVGVMGDNRTYDNTICVRAVEALDGMTATFSHLPHEFLESVSNRIINEVEGINRVVYDITSKPPGTIEWE